MAFSINTNLASLSAHRNLSKVDEQRNSTLERLSTGLRINRAADDAAGLSIANGFRAQSLGIGQAIQNGTDATSLVQIADGALEESTNLLNTIRTKAVQASSDGQTTETRGLIQNDINRLLTQLDNIAQNTSFNGQKLLSGAFTNKSFQIGANANQAVNVSIGSTESTKIGHTSTADLKFSNPDGEDVQLTLTSGITGQKLTLNTISVQANNKAENGVGALASEINRHSATTGIQATAVVQTTGTSSIAAGATGADFAINGVTVGAITTQSNDGNSALVNGINAKSNETGVAASTTNDGKLVLTANDGRAIKVTGDTGGAAGGTNTEFSTLGRVQLTQSGVSSFQVTGTGAGATGVDFTTNAATLTVADSSLATGSVLQSGSVLTTGSVFGGTVDVNGTTYKTTVDSVAKSGSTLESGSTLVGGTTLAGTVVTQNASTALLQDTAVASGSTIKSSSILSAGTLVTSQFTSSAVTYKVGDTLSKDVTLDGDVTLTAALTINGSATATLAAGSTLKSGSVLGVDTVTGADTVLDSDQQVLAGSTLLSGSLLLAGSTAGASLTTGADSTLTQTGLLKAGSTIASTSTITAGSTIGGSTEITQAVLLKDQTLKSGSVLASASILKAGTLLTQDLEGLKAGTVLTDDLTLNSLARTTITTDLTLKAGSTLTIDSVLAVNTTPAGSVDLSNEKSQRLSDINVLTTEGAQSAISIADSALKGLNNTRASLGAVQNQLTSTIANLSITRTNVNAAESAVRDVDFATEASNFSRLQVLSQAGSYALSQANSSSQSVLSLLQR